MHLDIERTSSKATVVRRASYNPRYNTRSTVIPQLLISSFLTAPLLLLGSKSNKTAQPEKAVGKSRIFAYFKGTSFFDRANLHVMRDTTQSPRLPPHAWTSRKTVYSSTPLGGRLFHYRLDTFIH